MLYEKVVRPLLFSLNPEFVHHQTIRLGSFLAARSIARRLARVLYAAQTESLKMELWGLQFPNPVGLAAGFDKHGQIPNLIEALGFGHMEVGSVSLRVWPGNPSPTLLRLPRDWGLINRLGLNSEGSEAVFKRLQALQLGMPLGVNLVKTADPQIDGEEAVKDYLESFIKLHGVANFVTLNLSCPNTEEGKTFEDPELLRPFLKRLQHRRARLDSEGQRRPVLIKLSPDLEDASLDQILELSESCGIDGFVIGNTTTRRENLTTSRATLDAFGFGGLSGRPLKKYVQDMVSRVFERTGGRYPLIALGGIGCDPQLAPAREVWEYFKLGATMVQVYTGLIYRGPSLVAQINRGLERILSEEGFSNLTEFFDNRRSFVGGAVART